MADANFTLWSAGRFDRCAMSLNGDMIQNNYEDVPLVHAGADHLLPGMHQHNVALHDGPRKLKSELANIEAGYIVGVLTLPNGSRLKSFAVKIYSDEGCTFDVQLKSGEALAPETMNRVSYDADDIATVAGGAVTGIDGPQTGEQRVAHVFYFDKGLITPGNADELQLVFASVPAEGLSKLPRVYINTVFEDTISHW